MTTTYDPKHPNYTDEADVRGELTRVYDICHECQLCIEFCSSFPTLFEMIDRHDDHDAGRLTPADQDRVVDECFQCKLCAVNCPYVPGLHESNVDFPRLMLRATAMQHGNRIPSIRSRRTTEVLARTDLIGKIATTAPRLANRIIGAKPGSLVRKAAAATTGVSSERLLPRFATQRFSTWFTTRATPAAASPLDPAKGAVTIFPTCVVEYQDTDLGKDLVKVYERNSIGCSVSSAGCCGAPWLHAGHVDHFTKLAKKNISTLAAEIRRGTDVVVAQPACSYVLKQDYIDYVGGADAELVAAHTYDASEYLMKMHMADGTFDTEFDGDTVTTITYHVPGTISAQGLGSTSRALLELTGAMVTSVEQASGVADPLAFRAGTEETSAPIAAKLGEMIDRAGGDIITSDCHLANTVILEHTGTTPNHPIQVVARAYGISSDL